MTRRSTSKAVDVQAAVLPADRGLSAFPCPAECSSSLLPGARREPEDDRAVALAAGDERVSGSAQAVTRGADDRRRRRVRGKQLLSLGLPAGRQDKPETSAAPPPPSRTGGAASVGPAPRSPAPAPRIPVLLCPRRPAPGPTRAGRGEREGRAGAREPPPPPPPAPSAGAGPGLLQSSFEEDLGGGRAPGRLPGGGGGGGGGARALRNGAGGCGMGFPRGAGRIGSRQACGAVPGPGAPAARAGVSRSPAPGAGPRRRAAASLDLDLASLSSLSRVRRGARGPDPSFKPPVAVCSN
eukprot:tig00000157_g9711.t1